MSNSCYTPHSNRTSSTLSSNENHLANSNRSSTQKKNENSLKATHPTLWRTPALLHSSPQDPKGAKAFSEVDVSPPLCLKKNPFGRSSQGSSSLHSSSPSTPFPELSVTPPKDINNNIFHSSHRHSVPSLPPKASKLQHSASDIVFPSPTTELLVGLPVVFSPEQEPEESRTPTSTGSSPSRYALQALPSHGNSTYPGFHPRTSDTEWSCHETDGKTKGEEDPEPRAQNASQSTTPSHSRRSEASSASRTPHQQDTGSRSYVQYRRSARQTGSCAREPFFEDELEEDERADKEHTRIPAPPPAQEHFRRSPDKLCNNNNSGTVSGANSSRNTNSNPNRNSNSNPNPYSETSLFESAPLSRTYSHTIFEDNFPPVPNLRTTASLSATTSTAGADLLTLSAGTLVFGEKEGVVPQTNIPWVPSTEPFLDSDTPLLQHGDNVEDISPEFSLNRPLLTLGHLLLNSPSPSVDLGTPRHMTSHQSLSGANVASSERTPPHPQQDAFPSSLGFHRSNSTGSSSSSSSSSTRGMNPAFCLSPRAFSDDALSALGTSGKQETPRRVMTLMLDKEKPPRKELCDVSLPEERQTFLFTRCLSVLSRMTPASVVQSLLPVLLACLENDDENHDHPEDSSIEVVAQYCLPEVFEAVQHTADMPMMAAFIMPMLHLCTAADRRTFPIVSRCLQRITDRMKDEGVVAIMVPLVQHLRFADCSLPRAIAAGVLHAIAARPGVLQATNTSLSRWFSYYMESAKDTCPIVREAAVDALTAWVEVAQAQHIALAEMPFPLFHDLMADDLSDTVRYLLVDRLMDIAEKIGKPSTSKYICPPFYSAVKDRSWRVRYRVARFLGQLAQLVVAPEEVLSEALSLSRDEEVEIRAAVAEQLGVFVPLVSATAGKDLIVPTALRLADDENRTVQLHMIAHIAPLASISHETAWVVCKRITAAMEKNDIRLQAHALSSVCRLIETLYCQRRGINREQLLPGIPSPHRLEAPLDPLYSSHGHRLSQLSSTRSVSAVFTSPDAELHSSHGPGNSSLSRHHSLRTGSRHDRTSSGHPTPPPPGGRSGLPSRSGVNFYALNREVSKDAKDATHDIVISFVDRLTQMSRSSTWRVREAVLSCIPSFALVLPLEQFQKLNSILRRLTLDPVSKVRQTAAEALQDVAERAGPSWAATMASDLLTGELGGALQHSGVWRLLTIRCLTALLPVAAHLKMSDPLRAKLRISTVDILKAYANDTVPMVRTALAEVMGLWRPWFYYSETLISTLSPSSSLTSPSKAQNNSEMERFYRSAVQKLESHGHLTSGEAAALCSREEENSTEELRLPVQGPYSSPSLLGGRRNSPSAASRHSSLSYAGKPSS